MFLFPPFTFPSRVHGTLYPLHLSDHDFFSHVQSHESDIKHSPAPQHQRDLEPVEAHSFMLKQARPGHIEIQLSTYLHTP